MELENRDKDSNLLRMQIWKNKSNGNTMRIGKLPM